MEELEFDNEMIAKLGKELMEDMQVNLMNVRDKSMTVSSIRAKWVMKYFKEKEIVRKLKDAKSTLLQKGVEGLQTTDTQFRNMSKIRLEEKISRESDKIKKINEMLSKQNEVVQFMEYALNVVSDFNFTVKHALDAIKLEQT
tara:strand:+ start:77 stop:502 length:426 start_codon:yes stop_codon:yes gene_type:complete